MLRARLPVHDSLGDKPNPNYSILLFLILSQKPVTVFKKLLLYVYNYLKSPLKTGCLIHLFLCPVCISLSCYDSLSTFFG
jgi:hypothetical protein